MAGNWRRLVAAFVLGAALFTTVPVWGQDLNTLLVNFITDMRNGTLGVNSAVTSIALADGSTTAPAVKGTGANSNTGWFWESTDRMGLTVNDTQRFRLDGNGITIHDGSTLTWGSSGVTSPDLELSRGAANQLNLGTGDSFNIVLGKFGYGAQSATVNGATTLALTAGRLILDCTGAEQINTITGGLAGMTLIIEHGDTECTLDDDDTATAADAIDLVGTATDDVGAVNKIIVLYYNGSHWLQVSESDN